MNFLRRFWNWFTGKDLPSSVAEPEKRKPMIISTPRGKDDYFQKIFDEPQKKGSTSSPYEPFDTRTEEEILEEKLREEWLPEPTTTRKTHDKFHRPPAAQHDIGRLMRGTGSKRQHQTYKASKKARIQPEEEA